jgi:hypothetical protein
MSSPFGVSTNSFSTEAHPLYDNDSCSLTSNGHPIYPEIRRTVVTFLQSTTPLARRRLLFVIEMLDFEGNGRDELVVLPGERSQIVCPHVMADFEGVLGNLKRSAARYEQPVLGTCKEFVSYSAGFEEVKVMRCKCRGVNIRQLGKISFSSPSGAT